MNAISPEALWAMCRRSPAMGSSEVLSDSLPCGFAAIFFATITNVIAYLPFLMLAGNTGQFLRSLSISEWAFANNRERAR
jgi:hypothetical protein